MKPSSKRREAKQQARKPIAPTPRARANKAEKRMQLIEAFNKADVSLRTFKHLAHAHGHHDNSLMHAEQWLLAFARTHGLILEHAPGEGGD